MKEGLQSTWLAEKKLIRVGLLHRQLQILSHVKLEILIFILTNRCIILMLINFLKFSKINEKTFRKICIIFDFHYLLIKILFLISKIHGKNNFSSNIHV